MQKKKLLITGGAGYIGSVLVNRAVGKNLDVHVLDSASASTNSLNDFIEQKKINYFQGDISDHKLIETCVKDVDYVIHLAGVSDGKAGKANPELTKKVNVDSFRQLLSISENAGVEKFIFASTMGVYGNEYKIPLHEDLKLNPVDPYSESKALGEELIKNANTKSFSTTALRMAMVYGVSPSMRFDFIVNRLTIDALQKKKITIVGGTQKRPQVHIDDLSNLFLELLSTDKNIISNKVFNVVGENPSIEYLTQLIKSKLPDIIIEKLPAREHEDTFEMDGSKLQNETGFKFQKDLKIGVEEIIKKYSV